MVLACRKRRWTTLTSQPSTGWQPDWSGARAPTSCSLCDRGASSSTTGGRLFSVLWFYFQLVVSAVSQVEQVSRESERLQEETGGGAGGPCAHQRAGGGQGPSQREGPHRSPLSNMSNSQFADFFLDYFVLQMLLLHGQSCGLDVESVENMIRRHEEAEREARVIQERSEVS